MPRATIQLHLPQPCAASWEAMTPATGGRHCAACQQVVVDFTAFTDGQLAAYLARPGKLPCGRFRASQLDRVLLPVAAPVAGWRRWLGAVAALLGLGVLATPARAQAQQARPATAQNPALAQKVGKPVRHAPTPGRPPQVAPAERVLMGDTVMLTGAPQPVPHKAIPKK